MCQHVARAASTCRWQKVVSGKDEKRQQFEQVQKRQSATWENTAYVESAPRNALIIRAAVKCVIWDTAKSSSEFQTKADSQDERRWR